MLDGTTFTVWVIAFGLAAHGSQTILGGCWNLYFVKLLFRVQTGGCVHCVNHMILGNDKSGGLVPNELA